MPTRTISYEAVVCSFCLTDTPTSAFRLSNGSGPSLEYDICEACKKTEPVATFLSAGERRPEKAGKVSVRVKGTKAATAARKKRAGGELTCDQEGCDFSTSRSQALGAHRAHKHGIRKSAA